jgi:tRNA A37 threonylcarbamoyltransferase TsaD
MEPVSRRSFFKQAGAVAATAGTMAVAPITFASTAASAVSSNHDAPLTPEEHLRGNEELVAHIKNARTGEISLFVGHREVTLRDRKIAARLIRATR